MKHPMCPRAWEVEAARDGRLLGEALAKHERHRQTCPGCQREHQLASRLSEVLAGEPVDEVALRRARASLLERAHGRSSVRSRPTWSSWTLAAAVALLVALGFWLRGRAVSTTLQRPTALDVAPADGARWTRRDTETHHRIDLSEGTLELTVTRSAGRRPVVVQVPDGEIEDLGTRFRVVVHDAKTESIVVNEGSVVFRRPALPDVRLSAGERWDAPRVATASPTAAAVPEAVAPMPAPARRSPPPSSAPTAATPPASGEEDVAYLRVVGLLREGRAEEARLEAREYLRRYPDGFRRREMERIGR